MQRLHQLDVPRVHAACAWPCHLQRLQQLLLSVNQGFMHLLKGLNGGGVEAQSRYEKQQL